METATLNELAEELGVYEPLPIGEDETGYLVELPGVNDLVRSLARAHELLADAVAAVEIGDRDYRAWRATLTQVLLKEDSKLSEWKVKASIEEHAQFISFKREIVTRQQRVDELRGYVLAIQAKVSLTVSLLSE